MAPSAHCACEREASCGSAAYEEGFHSFPVSLPFAPFGALTEHQRAYYEGWTAAACGVFGSPGSTHPGVRHDA